VGWVRSSLDRRSTLGIVFLLLEGTSSHGVARTKTQLLETIQMQNIVLWLTQLLPE